MISSGRLHAEMHGFSSYGVFLFPTNANLACPDPNLLKMAESITKQITYSQNVVLILMASMSYLLSISSFTESLSHSIKMLPSLGIYRELQ